MEQEILDGEIRFGWLCLGLAAIVLIICIIVEWRRAVMQEKKENYLRTTLLNAGFSEEEIETIIEGQRIIDEGLRKPSDHPFG